MFEKLPVVLHRLRLSSWAFASLSFGESHGFFISTVVFFPFCLCGLSFFVTMLDGHSRDLVVHGC